MNGLLTLENTPENMRRQSLKPVFCQLGIFEFSKVRPVDCLFSNKFQQIHSTEMSHVLTNETARLFKAEQIKLRQLS